MNVYRVIGDAIASLEARELAERLVSWHDAMVKHLRAVTIRGAACDEECPHEQARLLWSEALEIFGGDADRLAFLRTHGGAEPALPPSARVRSARMEARA